MNLLLDNEFTLIICLSISTMMERKGQKEGDNEKMSFYLNGEG